MQDFILFRNMRDHSSITVNNGLVSEVSQSFVDMTEYLVEDVLNKNIRDVFTVLKIGPGIYYENIDENVEYFLFTKSLEVRFINIEVIEEMDKQIYIFIEKPNSCLDNKFPFASRLCSDNHYGFGIYSLPDFTLLKANKTLISSLDNPYNKKENCIGKQISEFITGFQGSTLDRILQNIIATGQTYNIDEYMFDGFERGITYWEITLTPIFEEGKLKYCFQMITEITEQVLYRKKIEEQAKIIEHQKSELEAIIDNMSDGLLLLDKNYKFTMLNKAAENYFYNPDSVEKDGDDLTYTKYYDRDGNELKIDDLPGTMVLRGEKVEQFFMNVKRPDKTMYYSISGRPIYNLEGTIEHAVLCLHDISEKVKYEQEIKERKEQLEAILDNIQECLLVFDKNGKYIIKNRAVKEHLLITFDKLGNPYKAVEVYDMQGNKLSFEDIPNYRVKCGETVKDEIMVFKFGKRELYLIVSGTPIFNDKGDLLYGVIAARDITDFIKSQQALEEIQRQLLQTEKEKNEVLEKAMEMKDEFLSTISHEFRTPLNVITTAIQAMNYICADELSDKSKRYINTIKQNTFRQLRLVNNLLDITRADAGKIKIHKKNMDIVFLTNSIVESVHVYASQKGIMLTFMPSIGKKIIGIDDEKYERILLNLLSNAIKFTPADGLITVKLRTARNNTCIEVKDNGIGIPTDKVDVIFERFGQVDSSLSRQAEGAGIGLSLVKRLVEALNGSITVKSKVGKGSTFTILLPVEKVLEESEENPMVDLLDNRLVQTTTVEFSDIYL